MHRSRAVIENNYGFYLILQPIAGDVVVAIALPLIKDCNAFSKNLFFTALAS